MSVFDQPASKDFDEGVDARIWLRDKQRELSGSPSGRRLLNRALQLTQAVNGRGGHVRFIDMLKEVLAQNASGQAARDEKFHDRAKMICALAVAKGEYVSYATALLQARTEK